MSDANQAANPVYDSIVSAVNSAWNDDSENSHKAVLLSSLGKKLKDEFGDYSAHFPKGISLDFIKNCDRDRSMVKKSTEMIVITCLNLQKTQPAMVNHIRLGPVLISLSRGDSGSAFRSSKGFITTCRQLSIQL